MYPPGYTTGYARYDVLADYCKNKCTPAAVECTRRDVRTGTPAHDTSVSTRKNFHTNFHLTNNVFGNRDPYRFFEPRAVYLLRTRTLFPGFFCV